MKERQCACISTALRRLERMDRAIENGNFAAALGYKVTADGAKLTVEVEIVFKPHCCIKRPKKK
jgi:hypothetical protein